MARQPGQEKPMTADDPMFVGLIVIGLYLMGWAAWHFGHTHISTVYGYARYGEFYLLHLVGSMADIPGLSAIHGWIDGLCGPTGALSLCTRDFSTVSWAEISGSSLYVNLALVLLLVTYCVRLFMRANAVHPKMRFVRKHDIKSFINEQKTAVDPRTGRLLYPHLRMFSALNLIKAPLDHPVFGMSQTSRQFLFRHRLVAGWKQEGPDAWAPMLDRKRATDIFRDQLGRHWTSSVQLSPAETLLVAITMPRVAATDSALDDDEFKAAMEASAEVIRYCWDQFIPPAKGKKVAKGERPVDPNAWLRPKIDLAKPREVIKRYIGHKAVQAIIQRHAFNRTVIFALFLQARRLGVLQPAEMRWLRFYDRQLWYVLETIGRQAGFAEAAGVLSHYLYEAKAGTSIVEPQLDKAVSGLDMALNNFRFTDADKARYEAGAVKSTGDTAFKKT